MRNRSGSTIARNWPALLGQLRAIEVRDYSQAGAKVQTALRKAKEVTLTDGIVLLQIGANDLLGSTPARDFEQHLEALLSYVCGPRRTVLLFELPLPPFANEFGRIQRRLAHNHGVVLIPKRAFAGLLTADNATVDSVHLSRHVQELMGTLVWELIQGAYQ